MTILLLFVAIGLMVLFLALITCACVQFERGEDETFLDTLNRLLEEMP